MPYTGTGPDQVATHPTGAALSGSFTFTSAPGAAQWCVILLRARVFSQAIPLSYAVGGNVLDQNNQPIPDTSWKTGSLIGSYGFGGLTLLGPASGLPITVDYGASDPGSAEAVLVASIHGWRGTADDPITDAIAGQALQGGNRTGTGTVTTQHPFGGVTRSYPELAQFTFGFHPGSLHAGPYDGQVVPAISSANGWSGRATSDAYPGMRLLDRIDDIDPLDPATTTPHALLSFPSSVSWLTQIVQFVGPFSTEEPPPAALRRGPMLGLARGRRAIHT